VYFNSTHYAALMYKLLTILDKYFKLLSNLIFGLAIFIIIFQILYTGFPYFRQAHFEAFYKCANLLFSGYAFGLSISLTFATKQTFIRLARVILSVFTLVYFMISIFWITGLFNSSIDVEGFRQFFALAVGFIAMSFKISSLGNTQIHPALLFVLSFIFLILFGTFTLMLPVASYKNISFLDALFTSTSAVTVTGLAVLDTGKDFTIFGQSIIIILIQLGGLGVLTVTNIFALLFKSSTSFKNRMMVSEMIKELDNNNTFQTLFKIILITFLVELVGAILIFISIYGDDAVSNDPVFFSVFHSISAFCNGGFSTLTNSLYESTVRFNYPLQMIVGWLIITGGLGYTVMINHYYQLKNIFIRFLSKIRVFRIPYKNQINRTTTNSWLILVTTSILLVIGTVLFFVGEYDGTLKEHTLTGKIFVSIFNAVTPRTAGFNNINMAEMGIPAVMLTMALMWIGASPGSTGGGIKTTTFAVALLNLWNQIIGKEKMIVRLKEIPFYVINQVNAVILLSIFAISFGTFLISFFENQLLFKDILFECISAYSTVGLSIGITGSLHDASQIVLIILMFLGRVSFLTFLIALLARFSEKEKSCTPYYPKENVFIN
jgi:trk system potassium uptake protein TrkH